VKATSNATVTFARIPSLRFPHAGGMPSGSHVAAATLGTLVGTSLRAQTEPAIDAIGGGAAVGSALACAWALRQERPRWDVAMGWGAALGATGGAGLLILEMTGLG
jgi:hypothetical protein